MPKMSNHDTAHGYLEVMVDKLNHVLAHANGDSDYYCPREEDGDVFLREPCELLDPDGEFHLGQDDLSVEYLRDENGEVAHLRVCWTFGGPNAYLIRGWFGDRLLVAWGAEVAEHYGHEVTDLLDRYADILA